MVVVYVMVVVVGWNGGKGGGCYLGIGYLYLGWLYGGGCGDVSRDVVDGRRVV